MIHFVTDRNISGHHESVVVVILLSLFTWPKVLKFKRALNHAEDRRQLSPQSKTTLAVAMNVKQNFASTANLLWEFGSIPEQFNHHENADQKKMINIAQQLLLNYDALLQDQGSVDYEKVVVPVSIIEDYLDERPSRNPTLYLEQILKECDVEDKKARGTSEAFNLLATMVDQKR